MGKKYILAAAIAVCWAGPALAYGPGDWVKDDNDGGGGLLHGLASIGLAAIGYGVLRFLDDRKKEREAFEEQQRQHEYARHREAADEERRRHPEIELARRREERKATALRIEASMSPEDRAAAREIRAIVEQRAAAREAGRAEG